jgi:hypothetical protein
LAEESEVEEAVFDLGPHPGLVWRCAFVAEVFAEILPESAVVGVVGAIYRENYADGMFLGRHNGAFKTNADRAGEASEALLSQVDLASEVAGLKRL